MNKPTNYSPTTKKGYNLFEVSSAMQKSIRRGLVDDALYWAYELYNSNFEKYMWKRLMVMATEDIGLADPEAMQQAMLLYENYKACKELDTWERVRPAMAAVYILAKAKKSSFLNWKWGKVMDEHDSIVKNIPDYALDIHTRRGRMRGATRQDFFDIGSKLSPHHPVEDEEELKKWSEEFHKTKADPKWKQYEFLPMGHPDREATAKNQQPTDAPARRRKVAKVEDPTDSAQSELF